MKNLLPLLLIVACGSKTQMTAKSDPEPKKSCLSLNGNFTSEDTYQHLKINNCSISFYTDYSNPVKFNGSFETSSEMGGWIYINIINSEYYEKSKIGIHDCTFNYYLGELKFNCKDALIMQKFYLD